MMDGRKHEGIDRRLFGQRHLFGDKGVSLVGMARLALYPLFKPEHL
jgi:hypothetical protein